MGKVVKCPSCGSYYNGAIYSNCPYCSEISPEKANTNTTGDSEKTKGLFELIGKKMKNSGSPPGEPTYSVSRTEEAPRGEESPQPANSTGSSSTPSEMPETVRHSSNNTVETTVSLYQAISRSGRTIGKYISAGNGESVSPVVGWLVAVKGNCFGQDFKLKNGRNRIGRSHEMDVKLLNDESVSRSSVAVIIYDSKAEEFSILPGESDSLCYVNNKALYERVILEGYEELEFGDSGLNKYIFVPFCGGKFRWSDYSKDVQ